MRGAQLIGNGSESRLITDYVQLSVNPHHPEPERSVSGPFKSQVGGRPTYSEVIHFKPVNEVGQLRAHDAQTPLECFRDESE
jgi:hypothetical protein